MSLSRIKILHIISSLNTGGMENGLINLINCSTVQQFNHKICCTTKSGALANRLIHDIEIFELNKADGNSLRHILQIVRLLKKESPDIVHTRSWGGIDGIIAGTTVRVPIIVHGEHGYLPDDPYGNSLKRRLIRKVLSYAIDHYVAVSGDIKQWMSQAIGIKSCLIKKIINGVDAKKFFPEDKEKIKAFYGLRSNVVIGTVGRLDPIKQQHLLIKAFSMLEHNRHNLSLIIIGDGYERIRLEALRKTLPCAHCIKFFGNRDDVYKLYNLMDIFVLPSKNEGLSNTILEAMACGVPVIATSVGGNPELVKNGETGLLVLPNSENAIQMAITYYLENPEIRKLHGKNGRLKVEKCFSLQRMVAEYENLYKTLYLRNVKS